MVGAFFDHWTTEDYDEEDNKDDEDEDENGDD